MRGAAEAAARIRAAFQAGCRRFDAAIGGLGGCPFAQDALVGNIPTEVIVAELRSAAQACRNSDPLDELIRASAEIAASCCRLGCTDRASPRLPERRRLNYKTILVTENHPIRTITLNRPERRNAMTPEMQMELIGVIEDTAASDAVYWCYRGGRAFCSGLDLSALQSMRDKTAAEHRTDAERIARLFVALYELPVPTIAAVNGAAIAGGTGLATICDFTLATPAAKFGFTEVRIGFVPALVSAFLALQVGDKRSRDLLLTGRLFDAAEAHRIWVSSMRSWSGKSWPSACRRWQKSLMRKQPAVDKRNQTVACGAEQSLARRGDRAAMEANAESRETADFREGVSAFLEKRKPVWQK